ncbi:insulinase family protein [Chryseobacterium sp. SNU WT5]|uniref:M16 family metallopeptidase n=1 Tax=Chryseobacterium sp. SNU WT5 TaxID=2594269 RepID=UPI00117D9B80|nr:pitrilysin family protein [Chryseobacterium sp. SNU WT5]QDP84496.1 insulinase family protein [Chryseobacterium sp. SNU WT5]
MKKSLYSIAAVFFVSGFMSAQVIDLNKMPTPGPTPTVNITTPQTFKLKNGLTVLVVEDHKLPRVNTTLTFDHPPMIEGNKAGVSGIMANLLGSGTSKISKDDFNKKVDFLGASINYGANGAYANTLSKYYPEILNLFAAGITDAKFSADELAKAKERSITGLKSNELNAQVIGNRVFTALTYGKNTAMGEFETEQTLNAITLADVQDSYKKSYAPNNGYLVVIGDVKFNDVKKMIEKAFDGWKKSDYKFQPLPKFTNVATTEIDVVDVPTAAQSVILLGDLHPLKMKDPNYFAATTANYILGGGSLETRVNMNLREKNGYTYGAYTSLSTSKYDSNFGGNASVRGEVTDKAIKEFMTEIKGIKTIKADELHNAKEKLKGSFILSLERPETVARFALNLITQDLPKDFYTNYLKSVDALTIDQVQKASDYFIKPNNMRIFVAGKTSQFADQLDTLGYPVKYFDAYGNPVAKPAVKKVDASVTLAGVADKYIAAIGGKDKVSKITSITSVSTTKMQGMELGIKNTQATGGKMNLVVTMMGNTVQKMTYDGTKGYMEQQGNKMDMPAEMQAAYAKEKDLFPEMTFATSKDLTLGGIEKIEGADAYAVKSADATYYYDVKTGLKVGEVKKQKMQGQEVEIPTFYSNYKEVEGVKLPFTIKVNQMGQDMQLDVQSYELNKATAEDFK